MTSTMILRKQYTVNDVERGSHLGIALGGVRATGKQVTHFAAHRRAGWPVSPAQYAVLRRHDRHSAKLVRREVSEDGA